MRHATVLVFLSLGISSLTIAFAGCGSTDPAAPGTSLDGASGDTSKPDASGGQDTSVPDSGTDAPFDGGPVFQRTGGTFNALTIDPVEGTAFIDEAAGALRDAGVKTRLRVIVEDRTGVCTTGAVRQSATLLAIDVLSGDSPLKPGTFTQKFDSVPGQVDVGVSKLSATTCTAAGNDYGASTATVVLTHVTSSSVAGTLNVAFPNDAGTLTGTFNVPVCEKTFSPVCLP